MFVLVRYDTFTLNLFGVKIGVKINQLGNLNSKMAKVIVPLTFSKIKAAKPKEKVYKLNDGGGLVLFVHPSGLMKWGMDYRQDGKRKTAYLGNYPEFGLAEARQWREEVRTRLAHGEDAVQSKNVDEEYIFENVFYDWLKRWQPTVSTRYGIQVQRAIELNIFTDLKDKDIREIRPVHVVNSLRVFEDRNALEYLRRTKYGLKIMFDYAISCGLIDMNPVASIGAKTFQKHESKHFDALEPSELPSLIQTLEQGRMSTTTKLALYWQLLTMTRPNETCEATFDEIDLENKQWVIPPERMKKKRPHIVPLNPLLLDFLEQIKLHNVNGIYLFEGMTFDKPMSKETPRLVLRKNGLNTTAHGLRSLARTYLTETGKFQKDVLEALLAHVSGDKTEQAYNRALMLKQRNEALTFWANEVNALIEKFKE